MLSKNKKADVLINVTVEMNTMFTVLRNHYDRAEFSEALPELEKIEAYLLAKLSQYDPQYKEVFKEVLLPDRPNQKKAAKILSEVLDESTEK